MSERQFFKNLIDSAMRLVLKRVGFWSGRLYDVAGQGGSRVEDLAVSNTPDKWVVIVGRDCYFESVKDYPIGRLADVKDVLKNEPWRFPYKGLLQYKIERLSEQSHRVTSWVIKQEVLDGMHRRPLWVIPESACVTRLAMSSIVVLNRLDLTVYVSMTAGGLISSLGQAQPFFMKVGADPGSHEGADVKTVDVSGADAVHAMVVGILDNLKSHPAIFFYGLSKATLAAYPWRSAGVIFASITLSYLLLTSLYLAMASGWVDRQSASNRDRAEASAAIRRDIGEQRQKASEMAAILAQRAPLWVAWDILMDLTEMGTVIRAVNSRPPEVTFFLTAERATDVLSWLSEDPRVAFAEVTFPVRKVNEGEQFAVAVTLNNVPSRAGALDGKEPLVVSQQSQPNDLGSARVR